MAIPGLAAGRYYRGIFFFDGIQNRNFRTEV